MIVCFECAHFLSRHGGNLFVGHIVEVAEVEHDALRGGQFEQRFQ